MLPTEGLLAAQPAAARKVNTSIANPIAGRAFSFLPHAARPASVRVSSVKAREIPNTRPGVGMIGLGKSSGARMDRAVVVIVTVADELLDPFKASDPGVTVHVAACGAPTQAKATVWLNPPLGVTLKVKLTGLPAVVETEFVEADSEKLPVLAVAPVPESDTVCGLPEALSAIVSAPVRVPDVVGVKATLIEQFAPAANDPPQPLVSEKSPFAEMLVIVKAALPVFVRVTV